MLTAEVIPPDEWPDVVCGTSFIHALSGSSKHCKDDFYVEWHVGCTGKRTLVVLHHRTRTFDAASVGHMVEEFLVGKSPPKTSFHAATGR